MKALLVVWHLTAAHAGDVAVVEFPTLAACYKAVGAGPALPSGARVACQPAESFNDVLAAVQPYECTLRSIEGPMYFTCKGSKK